MLLSWVPFGCDQLDLVQRDNSDWSRLNLRHRTQNDVCMCVCARVRACVRAHVRSFLRGGGGGGWRRGGTLSRLVGRTRAS